jgi:hypothetical protein
MTIRFAISAVVALLAFVAAATWVGCGVKSKPVPPQAARPQRVLDLHAESVDNGVKLSWGRPTTYEAGGKMRNLGHFAIMRSDGQGVFRNVGEVPVTDQQRFQQQQMFAFIDRDTTIGHSYTYQIISYTQDNFRSAPSNPVEIERTVPRPPPNPETFVLPTPTPLPLP